MKKRISLILCAVLVLALLIVPMFALTASADDGEWKLVTDASELKAGDQVVIAAMNANYALSTNQKSSNRGAAAVTKDTANKTVTFGSDVEVLTLEDGTATGTLSFKAKAGYLYAASSSGNQLKTKTTKDANGSWNITIGSDGKASIIAAGTNSRKYFQYNPNNGSPLFACYSSASQQAVVIYKFVEATVACDHLNRTTEVVLPNCTERGYTLDVCADCGNDKKIIEDSYVDALGHTGCDDYVCDVCGKFEADKEELTIAEALALGAKYGKNGYTAGKYTVTGTVVSVENATYGNVNIEDEDGNTILVYGLYLPDGTRYDKMTTKPVVGDTITVNGIVGFYNAPQFKDATLLEIVASECEHADEDGDFLCDNEECGVVVAPEAGEWLSLEQAATLGSLLGGSYTTDKYYVTGIITEIVKDDYGNVYIEDAEGNSFYIYGIYSYDGTVRYDELEYAPQVNDEITIFGVIGSYNGEPQMKSGWLDEVVMHEHDYDADVTAPTCTADGYTTYTCACGHSYTEAGEAAKGHDINSFSVHTFCEEDGYITCGCRNCDATFDSRYDVEAQAYLEELSNMPFVNIDLSAQGHKYENGVCTKCQATIGAINEAQVNLGADLGVKWYVVLPEGADVADYVFTVEFLGESFVLEAVEADGRYMYFFANIAPQNMGDNMKATLALGENTVVVDNYSVKQNLLNIAAADATLETLVADLLNYGAAAQVYMDYNADNLVNADVAFAGSADEIVNPGYTLEGNAKENSAYFKSANVLFASTNRVIVKVVVNTNATLVVGDKTYNLTAGEHEIYSADIAATDLFDNVTFTLTGEDGNVTTLNYSVAAYAAAKAGNESAMGNLATALYYYAASIQDLVD